MSAQPTANAPVASVARVGVSRRASTTASVRGSSPSRAIVLRIRAMPLAELIITANMLETDATITGHFSHDA